MTVRTAGTRASDRPQGLDFEDFYRSEFPSLLRTMFLLTPDLADAEELAQEAMVRVYERWDTVGSMESPGAYVYRVAVNLHRRRLRRLAARARALVGPGIDHPHARSPESGRELAEAIASLSDRLREAFTLVDWLGMSSEQAGRILRIAPGSVRSRVSRARRQLREHLGLEEEDHG